MVGLRPRRVAWTALAVAGAAAILAAAWRLPAWRNTGERGIRQALFDELQPVALENCALARFGGPNDTGFLMCKNLLEGLEAAYSYGVVGNDDWGCDISTRYRVPVHQYDCLDTPRPVCAGADFVFHADCLGDRRSRADSRAFDTLANHIAANGHAGKRVVVKIDVEGAEWDALMATPDEVLNQIDQLPMEFHGVDERRFLEVIQKLKRTFHIVNLYFNNHACSPEAAPLPAWAYQVLFVNKRLGVVDRSEPGAPLPSRLNARDSLEVPDCQPEIPDRAERERRIRQELLDELRPVALQNCTMARFGSPNDGGYLMCENLVEDLGSAYSYGIGPNDDWGCDVSTRYRVTTHQYDCFDPSRPRCSTGNVVFHAECIGDRGELGWGRAFDTLANHIARNGDLGKRLLVKMDVEGAEWDALMAMPDAVFERVDQMAMELHGVDDRRFVQVLRKLKRTFHLVNLHFNNFACTEASAPLPAWAYQVLFVNKRIGLLDPAKGSPPPSPLNAPDHRGAADCQLGATGP